MTDPALAAEVDDPGASNVPTGAEAAPGGGVTAADQDPISAAGAPGELSSDQTPAQGEEQGETVPAESVGDVAGGDAGSPESGPTAEGRLTPEAAPGSGGTTVPEATGPLPVPAEPPPDGPPAGTVDSPPAGTAGTPAVDADRASPSEGSAAAVVAEQPASTPSASAGAAVQQATEEKVAQAVAVRQAAAEAQEPEPGEADDDRQHLIDSLQRVLGEAVVGSHLLPGIDVWVRVRLDAWRHAAEVCRDNLGLSYFCYLSAIDWLPSPYGRSEDPPPAPTQDLEGGEAASADTGASEAETDVAASALEHGYAGGESRFQLLARLVSPTTHLGLTLKADLAEDAPVAPSWLEVFPGADWHEREAWEMYGIDFTGHPNLTHLYLPGAFEGHPLRKDFPLLAREVKPWPGLVDVEAMPGEAGPAAGVTSEGGSA